ncbi:MAG TPA: protein YgfX [Methylophaga sp.]|nr:protein YgfX [Methylophaga sp.]
MSENVVNIKIKPSRRLRYLVVLMHLLAVSAVWLASLPIQIKFLLSIILVFSAACYWSAMLRSKADNEVLQYSTLEGWRLSAGDQQLQPIELQQCFISRPLVIINFRQADKRQSRLILSDSAEHDALRKLRILLHQTVS